MRPQGNCTEVPAPNPPTVFYRLGTIVKLMTEVYLEAQDLAVKVGVPMPQSGSCQRDNASNVDVESLLHAMECLMVDIQERICSVSGAVGDKDQVYR